MPSLAMTESKPRMNLSGHHAQAFVKHKIGQKGKAVVHYTKTSHYMGSTGNHDIGLDINKITPMDANDDVQKNP